MATSYLSSREANQDNTTNITDQLATMIASQNQLFTKILSDSLSQKSPAVNVYNSLCHLHKPALLNKETQTSTVFRSDPLPPPIVLNLEPTVARAIDSDVSMQLSQDESIDEIVLACTVCDMILETSDRLDHHMETVHGNSPENSIDDEHCKCNYCDEVFPTSAILHEHTEACHDPTDISVGTSELSPPAVLEVTPLSSSRQSPTTSNQEPL